MTLNLAELFGAVAAAVPEREALICDGRRLTFADLDAGSNRLAHVFVDAGIEPGERVALYMLNRVEHVEAMLAAFKARAAAVNVNWRYTGPELDYLFGDCQPAAVVVDAAFAPLAAAAAPSCPALRLVVVVGAGSDADWPASVQVVSYEEAVAAKPATVPALERSGDDLLLLYTGGTTGLPKGVMWRQEDYFYAALSGLNHFGDPYESAEQVVAAAQATPPVAYLLTAPLMHGAGTYPMFTALLLGSPVVITERFSPAGVLRLMVEEQIPIMAAVGDAIVRPIAEEIAAHPDEYDLSTWFVLGSGGALLSAAVREQLLAVVPHLYITNGFGASESGVDGRLDTSGDGPPRLEANPQVRVVDADLRPVAPGEVGHLAKSGHVPLGYFGDPDRTAATFPIVDGVRWAVLGDLARLEEDGAITVLGRGSTCINTGGEKVFPEEVEQALKAHPAVLDALVAGVPDARFGERVGAVVQLRPDVEASGDELRGHCRAHVAGYKVPAHVALVPVVVRSPTGKPDYRWAREELRRTVLEGVGP